MGDMFSTRWYKVTTKAGGSIEFSVLDRFFDGMSTEREVVAHEAWRQLFATPKINRAGERNGAANILRNLCDSLGVDKVKKQFTDSIEYERIR